MKFKKYIDFLTKISIIVFLVLSAVVIVNSFALPYPDVSFAEKVDAEYKGWYYIAPDGEKKPFLYGEKVPSLTACPREYTIYNRLPNDLQCSTYIFVRAAQESCVAFIDGKKIYELKAEHTNKMFPRMTGYMWNMIELHSSDAGKEIAVNIIADYKNGNLIKEKIYMGFSHNIVKTIVLKNMPFLLPLFLLMLIGLVISFSGVVIKLKVKSESVLTMANSKNIFTIGLILVLSSLCLLLQQSAVFVIVSNPYYRISMVYITMFLFILCCMIYVKRLFVEPDHKTIQEVFILLYLFYLVVVMVFKILGLKDTGYLLRSVHIIVLIYLFITVAMAFREVRLLKNTGAKNLLIIFTIVLFAALFEVIRFNALKREPSPLTIVIVFCVIVLLVINSIGSIINIIKNSEKASYFESLSNTDPMTQLKNRLAFAGRIAEIKDASKTKQKVDLGIVMVDLNNLKYVNDNFGHLKGDNFLITVADILKLVFRDDAEIFRIGCDEFAVITTITDEMTLQRNIQEVNSLCVQKEQLVQYLFSVGIGFAVYHAGHDYIDDIVAKADSNMYVDKGVKTSRRFLAKTTLAEQINND